VPFVSVSLDLDGLDPQRVESLLFARGACAGSYSVQPASFACGRQAACRHCSLATSIAMR
jgi:hypothetical protein